MTYKGRCQCGNVQIRLEGEPMAVMCCHCTICQRSTGGPFAYVGAWSVPNTEVVAEHPLKGLQTSPYLTRMSCPDCGAAIYNAVRTERMNSNNVMIPLLENRGDRLTPSHHIYYADRAIDMDGGLPTFDGFKWIGR